MKTVILTWASSGLGKAIAKTFSQRGYAVVGLCRSQPDDCIDWIKTDLTDESQLLSAVEILQAKYHDFSLLINCAGDGDGEDIRTLDWENTEHTFRLNTIAPMILTSRLLPLIQKNNADIVNIGATIGFKPYEYFSVYGASKWGFRGWTENLQLELKKTQCRVIAIHPGGMETKGNKKRMDQIADISKKPSSWSSFMDPNDIAEIVLHSVNLPKSIEISEIIINRK